MKHIDGTNCQLLFFGLDGGLEIIDLRTQTVLGLNTESLVRRLEIEHALLDIEKALIDLKVLILVKDELFFRIGEFLSEFSKSDG